MSLLGFFGSKDLKESLAKTKTVKINGVLFKIKKINVLDFLDGSRVLQKAYLTYEEAKADAKKDIDMNLQKKVNEHYKDVFMAGVVHPKLSRKDEADAVCVDDLFVDPEMVQQLYQEIYAYTYGKKKLDWTGMNQR